METYLQTTWGDQRDNITTTDIKTVIKKIKVMDDEHGAFWVGLVKNEENVLEVHKDLILIGAFEDEPGIEYKSKGKDWSEVELLFKDFLADKIENIKSRLKQGEK